MVWAVVNSELETLKLLSQYLPARTVVNRCGVTRLGEDWLATSWPTACVKVLRLCFPMTNDADLLEAAVA